MKVQLLADNAAHLRLKLCFQWLLYLPLTNAIVLIKYRRPAGVVPVIGARNITAPFCGTRIRCPDFRSFIVVFGRSWPRKLSPIPFITLSPPGGTWVTQVNNWSNLKWNNEVAALVCVKDTQTTSLSPVVCGQIKRFITLVHQSLELLRACQSKC